MSVKDVIKNLSVMAVRLFFRIFPKREDVCYAYLFYGDKGSANGFLAKAIRAYFWEKYYKLPVKERLDAQTRILGGTAGVAWAKHYEPKDSAKFPPERGETSIGALDFYDVYTFFDYLTEKIAAASDKCTVIQLGASSGKEIFALAKKFPQHDFIYTDIFESVVEYRKKHCSLPNVSFATAAADSLCCLVKELATKDNVILSSGSAQCVYPEHLDHMFSQLARAVKSDSSLEVVINEPGDCKTQDPLHLEGSTPRGNGFYTHNYSLYAEKNGFSVVKWEKILPYVPRDQFPGHFGTCHLDGVFHFSPD